MKHPFETTLKLSSGAEYPVHFNMAGLIIAEERYGYDTSKLETDGEKAEAAANELTGTRRLRNISERVWIGILPKHPEVSFDAFVEQVTTAADFEALMEAFAHTVRFYLPRAEEGEEEKKTVPAAV